jgi:carbonic anhydrase
MDFDSAMAKLIEGNKRYAKGLLSEKDVGSARKLTKEAQHPYATVLTCSDSRVVPEFIFDSNVGELFVVRNAGNIVDDIVLGSLEYGICHLKTPILVVLGHEKCGAVTAACKGGECSHNIKSVMKKIDASAKRCRCDVEKTVDENSRCVVDEIRLLSPEISEAEKNGNLKIVRMKYYFEDGRADVC